MAIVRRAKQVQDAPLAAVPAPAPAARAVVHTDPLNELIVIAAAVVDWEGCRAVVRRYAPDFFQVEQHRLIWEGLRTMHSRALGWDPETLRQVTGGAADVDYVLGVIEARPEVPPNLKHHLEVLEWDRARVEAARGPLTELLKAIDDPRAAPDRVRALGQQVATALASGGGSLQLLRDPAQLRLEVHRDLEAQKEEGQRFPYGIDGLDYWDHDDPSPARAYMKDDPRMVVGTRPGKVTVVTASSGGGKSTVLTLIALAQANLGRRVAYAPWEPDAAPTLKTLAVQSLGYSRTAFNTGAFTDDEQAAVEREVERLSELIFFMSNPLDTVKWSRDGSHNERVLDAIEGFIADIGADVFVADLWDMGFRFEHEHQEREALNRQQAMGVSLGVHSILLQQQKIKELEKANRPNRRPARDLIKGSSRWVDVADAILGVYIPGLFKDVPIDVLELGVLKQRDGRWPLAVEFNYNPDRGQLWGGRSIPVHGVDSIGDDVPALDAFLSKGRR